MWSSITGTTEVQEHCCKKILSVTLLGSPTATCEVQALVPQKFNNTAVRKIYVTLLDSPTATCEVQVLVQHKFTISTKKNQVSFF